MCTSACLHWVMACHVADMPPECTPEQMRVVMQSGLHTHRAVQSTDRLLQAREVLLQCPLPPRYTYHELHGCVGCTPDEAVQAYCVGLSELHTQLQHPAGLLFTAAGHTSAVFAGARGLFHFDSAVAAVQQTTAQDLADVLHAAHRLDAGTDYSILVIRASA